jgi:hypothetical protein
MRAVSFFGAAFTVTGSASETAVAFGAVAGIGAGAAGGFKPPGANGAAGGFMPEGGAGAAGFGAIIPGGLGGGMLGAALGGFGGADGGFGADIGGTAGFAKPAEGADGALFGRLMPPAGAPMGGRPASGAAGLGAGAAAGGVMLGSCVVSFLGAMPGALMRTVSRLTIGVEAGLGGSVMRTVSFLGVEGLEEVSSAIKMRGFLSHCGSVVSNILRLTFSDRGHFFAGFRPDVFT